MRARTRLIPIAIVVLAGCGTESPRSRVVPTTESGRSAPSAPADRDAATKDPRRIATH